MQKKFQKGRTSPYATVARQLVLAVSMLWNGFVLSASPPPDPGTGLDPSRPPGGNFDLSHWYLGTPELPASGSVSAAQLISGFTSVWFYTGPDGAMVFWCPVTGGTTPNSTYPRSELREQINPPDNNVNWSAAGTHRMDAQCKVTILPSTGKIIIGQIHSFLGPARPLLKFVYDNGTIDAQVKRSPNADTDEHYTFSNVAFNSLITYRIVLTDGVLAMTFNGVTQTANIFSNDPAWASQTFYFKAGSYVQDNSGNSTEGGRVDFYQLSVSHSTVSSAPPSITKQPASQGTQLSSNVVLNVSAEGGLPLGYQWWKDGFALPDSTNSILPIFNAQLADSGAYRAVVTNLSGAVTSAVATLTVVTNLLPASLAEALDTTNLVWTANGTPPWVGNFGAAHDGIDAARSGALGDSQLASFQTILSGPGTLRFWWKVSSETNSDYLIFDISGAEQARISGEIDWQQRTFTVPAGTQTLKWTYSKNGSLAVGQDRGLVDEVQFQPQPTAITSQPTGQNVDAGATVVLNVSATGALPIYYQWRVDGEELTDGGNVRGSATASLTLSNVQTSQAGSYSVVVSNAMASITSSNALLIVNAAVPLSEALDTTGLVWTNISAVPWVGRPFGAHDGVDAACSRPIADGQTTAFQTTLTGPGTLSFWWKVSSETNKDYLIFTINTTEQARISGETEWQLRTAAIPAGSQVLKWSYLKNSSLFAGQDRGFVDEVQFQPQPPAITSHPAGRTVDATATVAFNVAATGTPPLNFQWRLNGTNLADGGNVRGANTASLILSNVQPAQAGSYSVIVTNAAASVTSSNALLQVNPILSLAEALDTMNMVWTTNGTPPWVGRPSPAHDAVDAACSSTIADSQTTSFQTTVNGPGTLKYWWRVSSETNKDYLIFYVGTAEQARISGEVDWQYRTSNVAPGSQVLKWTYSKNSSTARGLDHGWVDQVTYDPLPPPAAPGNLAASVVSMSQINLAWNDNSTNETGFRLERSTNGTTFNQIALLASNMTAYASTGLVGGLTYYYRLSATNAAGTSAYSTQAVATTPWFTVAKINFQPASAPVPAGYVADGGLVFGERGNGLIYGWNSSRTSSATDRNSSLSADQRYDTYITSGTGSSVFWEISVPNGTYNVLLVAGDAGTSSGVYRYADEGAVILNGTATSSSRWITGRAVVVVSDGRLTLANATGASNNKVCFIEIAKVVPLLTCRPDKTVECGTPWTFDAPAGAADFCNGSNAVITVLSTVTNRSGLCGGTFTATRQWRATDSCGSTNFCSQTVTVLDTTPPALACAPSRIVECGAVWSFDAPVANDLCSGTNVAIAIVSTVTNALCGNTFTTTRTWVGADACGNGNTCSQTITIVDITPPVLTCLPSRNVEYGMSWSFAAPDASDLCDGTNVAVSVISTLTNALCGNAFVVTRIWSAADACGNSNTCSQIINVVDTTPPILTCSPPQSVECGTPWSFAGPGASDSGDGTNVTIAIVSTITNALCGNTYAATRTWSATDTCGNSNTCSQTITVVDTTPPIITCVPGRTIECGTPWDFNAPGAIDSCEGVELTIAVVSTLTNAFCGNSFSATRVWSVTDACGNSSNCTQTIVVLDTTPPAISCPPAQTIEYGMVWEFGTPVATDLCGDSGVSLAILSTTTNALCGNTFVATRTWSAINACGNSNACAQTVTLVDTTPPTMLCADTNTFDPCFQILPQIVDAADINPQFSCVRNDSLPMNARFPQGTTVVSCTATDQCGNSASCQFRVTMSGAFTATGPLDQVACANSNVTLFTTASDPGAESYVWRFEGTVIPNASTASLTISNMAVENIGRYCVEVTGPCASVTNCATLGMTNCLPIELCTLTQGFYSNPDGSWNGMTSFNLLTNLLTSGPIIAGKPGVRSISIGLPDITALASRLPARGLAAALPDAGDQGIASQPLNNKGRLENVLLGRTLVLEFNMRLDPYLRNFGLTTELCTRQGTGLRDFHISPTVLGALQDTALAINSTTVAGLLELANRALAALPTGGASLPDIAAVLDAVNLAFDGCRRAVDCDQTAQSVPANDAFESRVLITSLMATPDGSTTVFGSNLGATAQPEEPAHVTLPPSKSVWWQWTPTQSGWVAISTVGSSFDTLVDVFTGSSLNQLASAASNDDENNLLAAFTVFYATAGTDYKITVDGYAGDSGNIVLTIIEGFVP